VSFLVDAIGHHPILVLVLDLVRVLVCLKVEEEEEREREEKKQGKVGSSRWQFMCPPSACPHANTASHDEMSSRAPASSIAAASVAAAAVRRLSEKACLPT
jgi:hypothetical protein